MGYRCKAPYDIERDSEYKVMEVVMMKRGMSGNDGTSTHLFLIDNQMDTLGFVQESMDEIISNIIRVNKMAKLNKKVEESAKMFEKNLDPLFTVMAESTQGSILDKLSISLKKALILMAMERYKSNKDSVCKALGISPDKLEGEMALCGIGQERRAA